MNRPVSRALSRATFIFGAILVAYLAFSMLSLIIGRGSWILITAVTVITLLIAIPFLDKAFGDKLPFLRAWPTPVANSRIRHYIGVLALRAYSPKTATTRKQITVSLLIAPMAGLTVAAALYAASLFRPLSEFGDDLVRTILWTSLGFSLSYITFHGLTFRLRVKYDLKSALLAIAIYSPILIFAFMAWMLLMPISRDGDALRLSWFIVWAALVFGILVSAFATLLHRVGIQPGPAPTFATHPIYRRAEIITSLASLAALAIIFLLSS